MTPTRKPAHAAFATVVTLFFAWGFITSNNDPLIAAMRGIYSLGYTEALLTQFAFFIAYGLASLPAAALMARHGAVRMVLGALATMIAASLLAMFAVRLDTYGVVLAALFVMAVGITALQVAANPLAAGLGDPSRSHLRLTLAQAFNSLGVVMGVHFGARLMLGDALFAGGSAAAIDPARRAAGLGAVSQAYLVIALFLLAMFVFIAVSRARLEAASASVAAAASATAGPPAYRDNWARLGALAIFIYVGAEVTIASLMINFLNLDAVLGLPLQTAGAWLANFYWGGALIGRFIGSALLTRVPAPRLLMVAAACATTLCCITFATTGPIAAYAALSVGLFNAVMFPIIFTLTLERSAAPQAATSGLLCTAIVGGAFVPLVAGQVADSLSLFAAFAVPALAYCFIVAFAIVAGNKQPVQTQGPARSLH
jgi:MFS transporter, FHS family, L-fucose permease